MRVGLLMSWVPGETCSDLQSSFFFLKLEAVRCSSPFLLRSRRFLRLRPFPALLRRNKPFLLTLQWFTSDSFYVSSGRRKIPEGAVEIEECSVLFSQ